VSYFALLKKIDYVQKRFLLTKDNLLAEATFGNQLEQSKGIKCSLTKASGQNRSLLNNHRLLAKAPYLQQ
jgi:hypothetical protein